MRNIWSRKYAKWAETYGMCEADSYDEPSTRAKFVLHDDRLRIVNSFRVRRLCVKKSNSLTFSLVNG
jgi:hypothetical protein